MMINVHDSALKIVTFLDNTKPNTLKYYNEKWTRWLETATSTFEVTIFKHENSAIRHINDRAFLSFTYKGKTYLFNVIHMIENSSEITLTCENLNFELMNETVGPFKGTSQSLEWYIDNMGLTSYARLTIGANEVSDRRISAEWEGTDTKLARLLSLANKFSAEIDFDLKLAYDGSIDRFTINFYQEYSEEHQGVGQKRNDVLLEVGKNLNNLSIETDKSELYNMIVPVGKDGLRIDSVPDWQIKNEYGEVEFEKKGAAIYAPISVQLYPSTFAANTQSDQWITREIEIDTDNAEKLSAEGLKALRKNSMPSLTYEMDGYIDLDIGDTVRIADFKRYNKLVLSARVFEQSISFTNPQSNYTKFGNIKALELQSSNLTSVAEQMKAEIQAVKDSITNDVKQTVEQIVKPLIEPKADANITNEMLNALQEQSQKVQEQVEARATKQEFDEFRKLYDEAQAKQSLASAEAQQALVRQAERLVQIQHNLGEMAERWKFLDTDITMSEEGVRIGNVAKDSYVLVSSNRISFFSGGNEVMYISQGLLHIDNGIFTKSLQIGRYVEEQYHLDLDQNVTRYAGGV